MGSGYERWDDVEAKPRPILRALLILLIGFAAGLVAMGYLLTHWDAAATYLKGGKPVPAKPAVLAHAPPAAAPPVAVPALVPADRDALSIRIGAVEGRLAGIEERAIGASQNADRAEGLLVASAARRALDRGAQLGYLEALLRERFGASQPQAVATVISAARQPVTLEDLRSGIEQVGPTLAGPGPNENWWDGMRRELADLIVVRHAEAPSPAPLDRLARVRGLVAAGRVDEALAEVARLPGRAAAGGWIASARRYVLARSALDRLETAALLQPHPDVVPPR